MNAQKIQRAMKKRERRIEHSKRLSKHMSAVDKLVQSAVCRIEATFPSLLVKDNNFYENPKVTQLLLEKAFPKMVAHYCEDDNVICVGLGYIEEDEGFCDFSVDDFTSSKVLNKKTRKYFQDMSSYGREQMMLKFFIDGYRKVVVNTSEKWHELSEQFGWCENWYADTEKAVVFIKED